MASLNIFTGYSKSAFTDMGFRNRLVASIAILFLVVLAKSIKPDDWSDGDVCTTGRCRCEGFRVDCSGTNITSDTFTGAPDDTQILILSNTDFQTITDEHFANLINLTHLDLCNASLTHISGHAFSGQGKLQYLNISLNENYPLTDNTTMLHPDLFANLTSLVELKMFGTTTANLPYTYPNALLSHLTSLQELWIDGLNNKTLGAELSALTQLRLLRFPGDKVGFGFCDLDTLADSMFDSVTGITNLTINRCGIQILGINVFSKLRKLAYLDLSDNVCLEIDAVSNTLGKLTHSSLSYLLLNHIYYTRQKTCGTVIDEAQVEGMKHHNITTLYLEDNAIVKVHQRALGIFPKTLKFISARNNEFEFNTYLFYLKDLLNLEQLDVSYQFSPNQLWFRFEPNSDNNAIGGNKNLCRRKPQTYPNDARNTRTARSVSYQKSAGETHNVNIWEQSTGTGTRSTNKHISTPISVCPQPPHKVPPIIPFLPPKMNFIDLSHCRINLPIYKITLDSNNSVRIVNASSSMLTCWEGPVYGLNKLEYLDLSNNLCTRVGRDFFTEFTSLTTLVLSQNPFGIDSFDVAGDLFRTLTKLEVLVMVNNRIMTLPSTFLASQHNLRHLNLRGNLLTEFYFNIKHMKNLTLIDLSYNYIAVITKRVRGEIEAVAASVKQNGLGPLKIDLSENIFHCYCINLKFLKWLRAQKNNPNLKVRVTKCRYEDGALENITDSMQLRGVIAKLEKECASKLPLIIGLTTGIVLLTNVLVGFTVHYYRWKLRYWWYVSKTARKVRSKSGYTELQTCVGGQCGRWKYDVYVAYAEEEKEKKFVLKDMKEYLANRSDMRLCIPEDFVPGQNVYGMIGNAIHVSRVSIFVVTVKSSGDDWFSTSMHMIKEESLARGKRVHLGIFLDDVEKCLSQKKIRQDLCDLVKANAFLEYPGDDNADAVIGFWNKCAEKIRQGDYQDDDWSEAQ